MALLFDHMNKTQRDVIDRVATCKMNVTNVADYYFHHSKEKWALNDFASPRPPFDCMWVEYKFPRDTFSKEKGRTSIAAYDEGLIPYVGAFVTTKHNFVPGEKSVSLVPTGPETPGTFGIYGGIWLIDSRTNKTCSFKCDVSLRFDLDDSGNFENFYVPNETILKKDKEEIASDLYLLHPMLMAFSFGNCKNIEYVEVKAPPKLNRRRIKDGKLPLVDYRIINVLPFGKCYKQTTRSIMSDGQGVALRIVPGHYARYGEKYNRGKLFGKYEGMFWIQQHTVGSEEHGVAKRDYNVVAAK